MKAEIQRRLSNVDKVEALFRSRVNEWINAHDFEGPGGSFAWRTRISDCRLKRKMYIENKEQRNERNEVVGSWYRFLEHAPLGRDPQRPAPSAEKHPPQPQTLFPVYPR